MLPELSSHGPIAITPWPRPTLPLQRALSMKRPSLSLVRRFVSTLVAFAIIAPAMLTNVPLVAQEDSAKKASATDEDLFKVPEGDAKELHAYMKTIAQTQP